MQGKLIIFSAPSGAGKTTIVHRILKNFSHQLEFSISACTRSKRPNEVDGKDYHFISVDEFKEKIKKQQFVEWEEVYPGQFYGTLESELTRIWNSGKHVIFDLDVQGGINLKRKFGRQAYSIFIMPPSLEILELRLKQRQTESLESLAKRVAKAKDELQASNQFDKTVLNDSLEKACAETEKLILAFLEKKN